MQTVHLDCSALRNISLEAHSLPSSIYIDGQDFINRFSNSMEETFFELNKQNEKNLRDYFAAHAMQSIIINSVEHGNGSFDVTVAHQDLAELSYAIADAMLKEREGKQNE